MLGSFLQIVQRSLQRRKIKKFARRVSFGDLITDRSRNAAEYGFGAGTTCYDSVLILGDVKVGKNCWIGPNVILDGTGGLEIGDYVCIDSGVQIYSHDSSRRFVSFGQSTDPRAATKIGSGVFIGPQTIITMGVTVGDRVMIGAMSFVNKNIPSGCTVFGVPATIRVREEPSSSSIEKDSDGSQ
jgi:acetyltransferase-like isoleucine patch superfamily enzyme